ncbi:MAG: DUF4381 domain-containing protein [Thiohalomonadales bacterium]
MSIESGDSFGNYLIHGIDEIIVPVAVSWWPSAPGWKVLAVLISILLVFQLLRGLKRWWHNRYRREALHQLTQLQSQAGEQLQDVVVKLPYYIKVTALQAYPRENVASLSGEKWLNFLDTHYSGPSFSDGVGKHLLPIAYLPRDKWGLPPAEYHALINLSKKWIATHEPASSSIENV